MLPESPWAGWVATAALLLVWGASSAARRRRARRSAEREAERSADAERARTYPDGHPSGWYRIADSRELERGQVSYVRCLGRHLAVFRGARSGCVFALDAHCPHFGANLGVGGRVLGDCIRCPFHGLVFHGSGRLEAVRGRETTAPIRARSWPVREYHDMICVYYDASGAETAPPYELPVVEEIESGAFAYRGRHDPDDVRMHLIEFAENSVDYQHFPNLHGRMRVPWTQVPVPWVRIRHEVSWEADDEFDHRARFRDSASLLLFGREIPRSSADATITFLGPGGIVIFRFDIPKLGQIVLFQTHTPLEPLRQRVSFRWYASRRIPRLVVSYVVGNWISQWHADIAIWENKIYQRRPWLERGDGPVHRMRHWYQQFQPQDPKASHAPARDLRKASEHGETRRSPRAS